jgi:peroxiredoxin
MTNPSKKSVTPYLLPLIILIVLLVSACAGASTEVKNDPAQPGSAGALSVSSSADGQLPKQEAALAPAVQQGVLKKNTKAAKVEAATNNQIEVQSDQIQPPAPAENAPLPAPVKPAVDLTIPEGPKVGMRAPDFTLHTVDGKSIQFSSLLGQPVVINYWATWCVPCKAEMPILEKIQNEYKARGVVFISVDAIEQDTVDKVQALTSELGTTFPVLLDQGNQFSSVYQAIFFPTTFFIDANGVIRHIVLGDSTEEKFRDAFGKLANGGF